MKNAVRNVSKAVQKALRSGFFRLGYQVAGHPWKTIALSTIFIALCLIGLVNFHQEAREHVLWIPQDSAAIDHKAWVDEKFS